VRLRYEAAHQLPCPPNLSFQQAASLSRPSQSARGPGTQACPSCSSAGRSTHPAAILRSGLNPPYPNKSSIRSTNTHLTHSPVPNPLPVVRSLTTPMHTQHNQQVEDGQNSDAAGTSDQGILGSASAPEQVRKEQGWCIVVGVQREGRGVEKGKGRARQDLSLSHHFHFLSPSFQVSVSLLLTSAADYATVVSGLNIALSCESA
jgi:hypothetical protein